MSGSLLSYCKPRRITQSSRDVIERIEDGNIVLHRGHTLFLLKKNESEIWNMCDGMTTIDEMVLKVIQQHGVPEDKARDGITRFLSQLKDKCLIEVPEGSSEGSQQ